MNRADSGAEVSKSMSINLERRGRNKYVWDEAEAYFPQGRHQGWYEGVNSGDGGEFSKYYRAGMMLVWTCDEYSHQRWALIGAGLERVWVWCGIWKDGRDLAGDGVCRVTIRVC